MSDNLSDLLRPLLALAGKATEIHAQTEQAVKDLSFDPENAALWVKVGFLHGQEGHAALSPELVKAMIRAVVAGEECLETYAFCQLSPFQPVIDMTTAHSELASLLRK